MAALTEKIDEVSKNSIWKEAIRKENRALTLNTDFSIGDPRKMSIYTEKPNRVVPASLPDEDSILDAMNTLSTLSCVKDAEQLPSEKFALPITSSMSYGFFARPLVPHTAQFDYKLSECDVTKYAHEYVKTSGMSPYARKDASKAPQ